MLPKLLIAFILLALAGCYEVLPETYTSQQLSGKWNLVGENSGVNRQIPHSYFGPSVSLKFDSFSSSYERIVSGTKVEDGKYETSSAVSMYTREYEPTIKFSVSGDTYLYKISNDSLYLDDNTYFGHLKVYVKSWY